MTQEILAYSTLIAAVAFLLKKFFWKKSTKKAKKNSKSCGDDCGCH